MDSEEQPSTGTDQNLESVTEENVKRLAIQILNADRSMRNNPSRAYRMCFSVMDEIQHGLVDYGLDVVFDAITHYGCHKGLLTDPEFDPTDLPLDAPWPYDNPK